MVWTVRGSNPGGARFSATVQTGTGAHPASCTMSTGSFPGVKNGRCVTLTPHPLLVLWSRKSRAIPLLPLWAVRSVQSLSACTRVHFTLPFICITNREILKSCFNSYHSDTYCISLHLITNICRYYMFRLVNSNF